MVIGSALRKSNKKIVEKVLLRLFDNDKYSEHLPRRRLLKIIDWTAKIGKFMLSIAFFLALYTVFARIVLPRAGFDKTIVLMLTVIIFVLRSFLEALGDDESPLRKK